ncbi:DNA (cytosine-5-)-methyltransferase [Mycoplasmopsis gallinarum]|uniref:Cytosine-specific methyltransferase n=1 Tax=Mycoplasmopsis gallinarum TaxID=29557 RepID=A0A168R6B0_9BACT|nr:DNA (cytosine-5-)-methyltransferase [Mycoplasmopsis gallinarum]OAB48639.1 CPG DNA methylase [Mycoplasmopsis gallinarum]
MKRKIRIFEAFSGIGSQNKSAKWVNEKLNYRSKFKVVATSDWDIGAIIAYAAIHHQLDIEEIKNLKAKTVDKYLIKHTFSKNSKEPLRNILKQNDFLKQVLYQANKKNHNQADIRKISGNFLEKFKIDLFTYSFPCQGLSVANMGRDKGINNKNSTSHLIWEVGRILSETDYRPKYLLLENVQSLVKKYHKEYEQWVNYLIQLGYKTFTGVFSADDHGSLQTRKRVFAISVLNNIKTPFKNDEEYIRFVNRLGQKYKLKTLEKRKEQYLKIYDLKNQNFSETREVLMNNTPSRIRSVENSIDLSNLQLAKERNFRINTLTTKQDRFPNAGYIPLENKNIKKLQYRFITPREAYKIMGFDEEDFNRLTPFIKTNVLNKDMLWRQAGNSIDTNILKRIFETIAEIDQINYSNEEEKNE